MSEFDKALEEEGFKEQITPLDSNPKVHLERTIKERISKVFGPTENLYLPTCGIEDMDEVDARVRSLYEHVTEESSASEKEKKEMVEGLAYVYRASLMSEYFKNIFDRDGNWRQGLLDDDGEFIRHTRIVPKASGSPADFIKSQLNIGNKFHVPLYRSGFWLTLRNPLDSELYDLETKIAQDKVNLGYLTNGLCFSSTEVYQTENIIDFVLSLYVSCTVSITDPEELKSLILLSDLPLIVQYIACSVYPKGYPLKQPCLADPDHCDHVYQELINLNNLIWVDNTKFTNGQIKHLKRKTHKCTVEEVKNYQDQFAENDGSFLMLNENTKIKFGVPSIAAAIEIGHSWVTDIQQMAQKVFNLPNQNKKRAEYIQTQTFLSQMRQYSHWIKAIIHSGGDEDVVATGQDVADILDNLRYNNELSTQCFEKIKAFIDYSTVSLVAIPAYPCPLCKKEPDPEQLKHPKLIPLDPIFVFFILRLQLISRRVAEENLR